MITVTYQGLNPYPTLLQLRKPQIDALLQRALNREASDVEADLLQRISVTGLARNIIDQNIVVQEARGNELAARITPTTERIPLREFAHRHQVVNPRYPTRARILAKTGLENRYVVAGGFVNPKGQKQALLRRVSGDRVAAAIGPSMQPLFRTLSSDAGYLRQIDRGLSAEIVREIRNV